ncbi:prenyltransferase/squalene oxidase repeat-containing protein, partial [Nostoc sp. NIES-2111]
MAIWALLDSNPVQAKRGLEWLINSINDDGGLGFERKCQKSNIAMTSMALFIFSNHYKYKDSQVASKAAGWILNNTLPNGLWEPIIDDWVYFDTATGEEHPCKTDHFSSGWAIMALLEYGTSPTVPMVRKSILSFLSNQEQDGTWNILSYDQKKHTWVVADGLATLIVIKNSLLIKQTKLVQLSNGSWHQKAVLLFLASIALIST